MILTRDAIKAIDDIKFQVVKVKAWDAEVKIKSLTAKEQLEIAKIVSKPNGGLDSVVKMVMLSVVDDNGEKIFVDGDEEFLKEKNFNALLEISDAATALNELGVDAVEEKAKN